MNRERKRKERIEERMADYLGTMLFGVSIIPYILPPKGLAKFLKSNIFFTDILSKPDV